MKTNISKCIWTACIAAMAMCMSMTMSAVGPPKDTITVTALTSDNGVVPTSPQPFPHTWFYVICVPSGGSLSDTLRLHFTDTDTNTSTGEIATISFSAVGNPTLTSGITVPSNIVMDDVTNTDADVAVPISMANPPDGNYTANLQISASPSNGFSLSHDTIHIQVTVGGACNPSSEISCFFTDSNFLDLTDCSGAEVTGNTGGTFQIVTNSKKIATATNPGQFYYNMLWSNTTGSDQTVTVNLTPTNLIPSNTNSLLKPIAQAAHAYFFDTATGFTDPLADWNFVNSSGQPCGPSGPCTITVPANDTLFVTWHLVWTGIGLDASVYSTGCANANADIQATGQVVGTNINESCTTDAKGYRKK
jgi:hypothetical protein